jgi:hypothetical protein
MSPPRISTLPVSWGEPRPGVGDRPAVEPLRRAAGHQEPAFDRRAVDIDREFPVNCPPDCGFDGFDRCGFVEVDLLGEQPEAEPGFGRPLDLLCRISDGHDTTTVEGVDNFGGVDDALGDLPALVGFPGLEQRESVGSPPSR